MLSIIIPVYNAEKYIDKCILSIITQSYKDLEIILVDDGSEDNSGAICEQYAKKDIRIQIIHQKNRGPNYARMRGLEVSKGEYVTFVDADDWISKQMCEDLLSSFINSQIDMVISNRFLSFSQNEVIEKSDFPQGIYNGKYLAENFFDDKYVFKYKIILSLYAKIFRRHLILRVFKMMNLSLKYGEDHLAIILALLNSVEVDIVDKTYYFYRQHPESIMHTLTYKECIRSQKILYRELMNKIVYVEKNDKIFNQIRLNIIHNLLLGGYSFFNDYTGIYPYEVTNLDERKIIIYGAGLFGRELYENFKKKGIYIKYIIDNQWEKCRKETGMDVKPLCDINIDENDIILVAVLKATISSKIIEVLCEHGVSMHKIFAPSIKIINSDYTNKVLEKILQD